jgi:hypothetical protein
MQLFPRVRRIVARHPWSQWLVIATLAVLTAASVDARLAAADEAAANWGDATTVWVAPTAVDVGSPVAAHRLEVPVGVVPVDAVRTDPTGSTARRTIGSGEIVTAGDLSGARSAPADWLIAPLRESPPSGAVDGEAVVIVTDGFVLADTAVVVGRDDGVTLVAVPAAIAPSIPGDAVTLLRHP